MMFKVKISELNSFFSEISKQNNLYIPTDDESGVTSFTVWEDGAELSKATNTTRSAKDFFFPQTENLVDFKVNGKKIEIIDRRKELDDFVIFGVRACDVKSFEILDSVYLADPVDSYYKNRRDHGIIISLACSNPDKNCFCSTFGIDAARPFGDARAYITGENLYIEALTEKGSALLSKIPEILEECDSTDVNSEIESIDKKLAELPLSSLTAKDFTAKQLEVFNSPVWADLSESCLGCGSCTFVCPTCQCYDIKDFDTGNGIKRFRCWDSCMYSDFTMMAHGTPRYSQLERFRQRFMHKMVYYPMNNNGIYGCVGCGRCLRKCPISMNIVKVMKALGDDVE